MKNIDISLIEIDVFDVEIVKKEFGYIILNKNIERN